MKISSNWLTDLKNLGFGYFQITIGILSASFGLKGFLLPNDFLDGGATGIALLLSSIFRFDLSILLVIINMPFLILAYFQIGRKLFWRSLLTVLVLALVIHFLEYPIITEDKLLIAIFGGVFLGMGIGLAIRGGAVLDGSEVLGIYLSKKFRISIGRVIMLFNIVLFLVTAFVVNVEIALYSILTFIVASKATDFVIHGFEEYIGVTIISKHNQQIREGITQRLGIGVTVYKGEGGFKPGDESNELDILHTIISRLDIRRLYLLIESIDKEAFIVEYDINDMRGGVVNKYFKVEH